MRTVMFFVTGTPGRNNFPRSVGTREERKRIRRSNAPTRRTREQTKSATLDGMRLVHI